MTGAPLLQLVRTATYYLLV